jgi:hypothetical protein
VVLSEFGDLMEKARRVAYAVGRSLPDGPPVRAAAAV